MKYSKIVALLLLPILLCTAGCSVKSGILSGYEKVVSTMGALTLTPDAALIGVRTPGRDDCTGAYAASCEKARGKDVVLADAVCRHAGWRSRVLSPVKPDLYKFC